MNATKKNVQQPINRIRFTVKLSQSNTFQFSECICFFRFVNFLEISRIFDLSIHTAPRTFSFFCVLCVFFSFNIFSMEFSCKIGKGWFMHIWLIAQSTNELAHFHMSITTYSTSQFIFSRYMRFTTQHYIRWHFPTDWHSLTQIDTLCYQSCDENRNFSLFPQTPLECSTMKCIVRCFRFSFVLLKDFAVIDSDVHIIRKWNALEHFFEELLPGEI